MRFIVIAFLIATVFSCKANSFKREKVLPVAQRELAFLEPTHVDCESDDSGACITGLNCVARDARGIKFFATCDDLSCWGIKVGDR